MDGRIALTQGTKLTFHNSEGGAISYVVQREIGRGGSCIVYDASYTDNLGNSKLVRIKECYPHALHIARRENGSLEADAKDQSEFEKRKQRLTDAYQQNHDLFSLEPLTNSVANTCDIYRSAGTVYVVSTYSNSETLAERRCASLKECVALLISTGKTLQRIHEAGYLYLDLKPENILTLKGSTDLVQLFDFDSMISMAELREAIENQDVGGIRTSYTKGFAPLEQQTGKLRRLGVHSDVFSLGAVLFYELWGRTPSAFDCDGNAAYDYEHMTFSGADYQDRLYRELTEFFHRTLASYAGDRYASMSEAVGQLERIAQLADETAAWIYSSPSDAPTFFTGREQELSALDSLLHQPGQHVFSLYGMGGIGKSTLVREYLHHQKDEYDAVLFLYDNGSAEELLGDDRLVRISTVEKQKEESAQEYLSRKLAAIRRICVQQHVIVVLDNFSPEHLEGMKPLFDVGWQVLLISRVELLEGMFPTLHLTELSVPDLARLFARYAHCSLGEEVDAAAFTSIAQSVGGHTLLMELVGRQIARNYLSLHEAAELTLRIGFSHLGGGRVDYVRDSCSTKATIEAILGQLLEQDRYSGPERHIMKLLSLFDAPGIPASLFREIAELTDMELVNTLADSGWLCVDQNQLSLHPIMREYVEGWPWLGEENYHVSAERLMMKLCALIQPKGRALDSDKQFPENYGDLYALLWAAEQAVIHFGIPSPAGQKLRFRMLMDAPVDEDENTLRRILALLNQPDYLDDSSILRLYNQAALFLRRLNFFADAFDMLKEMKNYLKAHPNGFYLSVYHNTLANILHDANAEENLKKCLRHQDEAIAAARKSEHPDAPRQLAACLLDKAMTLLDLGQNPRQCKKLIDDAGILIQDHCDEYDYERYHWLCIAAMFHARVTGEGDEALTLLGEATRIADVARDSTMSYADHLLDQCAPIYYEMGLMRKAIDTIHEVIRLCDENEEISSYRRLRFEAYLFLAQVYADNGDYIHSAEVYDLLENYREDSPYPFDEAKPLCPPTIREQAESQKNEEN